MRTLINKEDLKGLILPTHEDLINSNDYLISTVEYYAKHTKVGKKLIKEFEGDVDWDKEVEVASLIIANLIGVREEVIVKPFPLWYLEGYMNGLSAIANDIGLEFGEDIASKYIKREVWLRKFPIGRWWVVDSFTGFETKTVKDSKEQLVEGLKNFIWSYLDNVMDHSVNEDNSPESLKETNDAVVKFFINLNNFGYDLFVIMSQIEYLRTNVEVINTFIQDYAETAITQASIKKFKKEREKTLMSYEMGYVPYKDFINEADFQIQCMSIIDSIGARNGEGIIKVIGSISSLYNTK